MVLSSSSTTGRSKKRVALLRQSSREDNYEGPRRYCHHILEAPRWTAWTEGNLGRRFYGCPNHYKEGGCGFFAWHDEDFGERANEVIKELLDHINKLYDENTFLKSGHERRIIYEHLGAIEVEMRKLRCRDQIRESEARKGAKKLKFVIATLIMTWVWVFNKYLCS